MDLIKAPLLRGKGCKRRISSQKQNDLYPDTLQVQLPNETSWTTIASTNKGYPSKTEATKQMKHLQNKRDKFLDKTLSFRLGITNTQNPSKEN